MRSMQQDQGYRNLLALLALQTLAFFLVAALAWATPQASLSQPASAWLPGAVAGVLSVATLSLFAARTWTILAEPIFCMEFVTWARFFRGFLRPALYLAPLALAAAIVLQLAGGNGVLPVLPALLVGIAGGAASCAWLVRVALAYRSAREEVAVELAAVERLKVQHGEAGVRRLADSLEYASGRANYNPFQMRRGLTLLDLPAKPWFERSDFPWASIFEGCFEQIRAEALQVLGSPNTTANAYPGVIAGDWDLYALVADDVVAHAEVHCPVTIAALRQVPGFPALRHAFFSILRPGSRILPHCDHSNIWVTAHLGIQIPDDCAIRVGRETRRWAQGEFLFFDTSYEHEAWNHSNQARVILLFNFMNPLLTDAERTFFGP